MRIIVCGAGIAGLTLAWCLERDGHDVLVVERSPRLRDDGYMIDFFGSGYDASEQLGLLPDLAAIHYPIDRLVLVDAAGGERVSLPYPTLRTRLFADRHFNFMRGELERVLYARLTNPGMIRFGTSVESIAQDLQRVHVRLTDGPIETADLLIGTDGVHSHIRRLIFGPESRFTRRLGYRAAAYVLQESPPELRAAHSFLTITVPKRQVTVYPIRGGRLATFFLHKMDRTVTGVHPQSPCRELREVYGDLEWVVPSLLDQCPQNSAVYVDDVAQIELPRWNMGRVVLAGDACQCVSLLAGQGASMAVAGAAVLASELKAAPRDLPGALARYEHGMRPAIERQQRAGRRIGKWFVPEDRIHLAMRDVFARVASWPVVAPVLRRRMAAQSIFRTRSPSAANR